MNKHFPSLPKLALNKLLSFSTTWLYELGFSVLLYLKNKYQIKINPQNDLRIALTNIELISKV